MRQFIRDNERDIKLIFLSAIVSCFFGALVGWILKGVPAPQFVEVSVPVPPVIDSKTTEAPADYEVQFGWHYDHDRCATNLADVKNHFDITPAGRASLGDSDTFLWQSVRKVNNKSAPWYPNVNQKSVGCCVGCGWKHSVDVCQATQILDGTRAEWLSVSVEAIYAFSRVDVGHGAIRGDGSVGDWARQAVSTYGVVPMQKVGSVDLTEFSPERARDWGRSGVPADVKAAAKDHLVKGCALVKTWADVKKAIGQHYPIAVCSNQGFRMQRDANGFCAPQGSWGHCMAIIGIRTSPEGAFILNSWGDSSHTGPTWPEDAPVAGFWADAQTVGRMVAMGDSFALADIAGFPARKPRWFIRFERRDPLQLPPREFALAF